jgi:anti-anti-sigma regulatory factor
MTVLEIGGRIDQARFDELSRRATDLLMHDDELICDVRAVAEPDAATVDALARVQLLVKRLGREMRIRGVGDQLRELILFMGLDDVLVLEPRRKAE